MKIYIGTDPKDWRAFDVCVESIYAHTKEKITIVPIRDHELRWKKLFWRPYHVEPNGQMIDVKDGSPFSTLFSFQRFCVPMMNEFRDEWVLFMDPDMMLRADIAEVWEWADKTKAVNVVKHRHTPEEDRKMGGLLQTQYFRKNWSSFMLMNTAKCKALDAYNVNNMPGTYLHSFSWLHDEEIGGLPEGWNWLEGFSPPSVTPMNVHFTRGTPDMPGCENVAYADEWKKYTNVHHSVKAA